MNKSTLLILTGLTVLTAAGCAQQKDADAPTPTAKSAGATNEAPSLTRNGDDIAISPEQQKRIDIAVVGLAKATNSTSQRFAGRVVVPPKQERVASAPVAGLVDEVLVATGDFVARGKALARIRSEEFVQMQTDYLSALADDQLLAATIGREEQLLKEGVAAQRRVQETSSKRKQAAAALEARSQALRLAGFDDAAMHKLAQTHQPISIVNVMAPIDGVVLEHKAVTGARVQKLDALFRVAKLEPLWIEAKVPLEKAHALPVAAAVRTGAPTTAGTLLSIGKDVDGDTQTVLVRSEVQAGAAALRPGQIVDVEITTDATERFRVPGAALVRSGKRTVIFVQTKTGFTATDVDVLSESGGNAVVGGKFAGDETIAVRGTLALKGVWLGLGGEEQE